MSKSPGKKRSSEKKGSKSGAGDAAKQSSAAGKSGKPGNKGPSEFAGKTVASVFGEMVWLLSRSPKYRDLKLSDLEWLVMPPLLLRQFKLYYAGQQPVSMELFAKASPEVAARIDRGEKKLLPAEWRSGDITKLVEKIDLSSEVPVMPATGSKQSH